MIRLLLLMFLALPAQAAIDAYQFKSTADEKRFHELTAELRCPKCQNQNIADSDSPIAKDLRAEVYRMVDEGVADIEVIDFMVTRYGDFVLYRPKMNSQTWLLWYGPYLGLGLGVLAIIIILLQRRNRTAATSSKLSEVTAEERTKLDELLKQDKE